MNYKNGQEDLPSPDDPFQSPPHFELSGRVHRADPYSFQHKPKDLYSFCMVNSQGDPVLAGIINASEPIKS